MGTEKVAQYRGPMGECESEVVRQGKKPIGVKKKYQLLSGLGGKGYLGVSHTAVQKRQGIQYLGGGRVLHYFSEPRERGGWGMTPEMVKNLL